MCKESSLNTISPWIAALKSTMNGLRHLWQRFFLEILLYGISRFSRLFKQASISASLSQARCHCQRYWFMPYQLSVIHLCHHSRHSRMPSHISMTLHRCSFLPYTITTSRATMIFMTMLRYTSTDGTTWNSINTWRSCSSDTFVSIYREVVIWITQISRRELLSHMKIMPWSRMTHYSKPIYSCAPLPHQTGFPWTVPGKFK